MTVDVLQQLMAQLAGKFPTIGTSLIIALAVVAVLPISTLLSGGVGTLANLVTNGALHALGDQILNARLATRLLINLTLLLVTTY